MTVSFKNKEKIDFNLNFNVFYFNSKFNDCRKTLDIIQQKFHDLKGILPFRALS